MGLRSSGSYATVWEVRKPEKGNYMEVQLSTSKKDPRDESKYIQDFSGWVRFIGSAKTLAESLKRMDRIRITSFEVTNNYNKETKVTYVNYTVFEAEMAGSTNNRPAPTSKANDSYMQIPDNVEDEGLPFN